VVPAQRRDVRQEEVRDEDRLGASHVRVRRHQRLAGGGRPVEQRPDEGGNRGLELRHAALQIKAHVDRDLLVARSTRVEAAAGLADPRNQLALDEGMHIFVRRRSWCAHRLHLFKRGTNRGRVLRRENTRLLEPLRPRNASSDVVFEQPAIERERRAELEEFTIRISLEPPRPQMRH
jgi:hypothetical protein